MLDNAALSHIKIASVKDLAKLDWASQEQFCIPTDLLNYLTKCCEIDTHGSFHLTPAILTQEVIQKAKLALEQLRLLRALTEVSPVSSRLPISYQYVPAWLRDVLAHSIGRIKRLQQTKWAFFPIWPLDLSSDFLADLANVEQPLPKTDKKIPVLITHDLDSAEGLENSVRYFLDIEEAFGARSANYIVPCGWPINPRWLETLFNRGHEIGIHGFDHSNLTPFAVSTERHRRLFAAKPLIERYQIFGYRAPSLLRTKALLQDLTKLYLYDSSIPTSGGLFPIPNNGCATARPFNIEGILEIPITLPRDGSLLFLGYSPKQILEIWKNCALKIAKSGGIVHLLVHCENRFSGKPVMRKIYRDFLSFIADNKQFTFTLPKDLCAEIKKQEPQ